MSRYCKEKLDEAHVPAKRWFGGLAFPPSHEDYERIKEWTVPRIYDRVEGFTEAGFKDIESDLSDIGEDEPVERGNQMWLNICEDHWRNNKRVLDIYEELKRRDEKSHCRDAPETEYIMNNLFPMLRPALEAALLKAYELELLKRERTGFDPVDLIAELLWNMNPRCPNRSENYRTLFEILPFKKWLRSHPRPDYPRHYFWDRVQSAICIQRNYRGYLIRRREDVQQLREFWQVLKGKKRPPDNDPELTFGMDITAYKEHYPDLAKWNQEQQEKRLEAEKVDWLKEEGLWGDELEETVDETDHLRYHSVEIVDSQMEELLNHAVNASPSREKPVVKFGINLIADIGD